MRIDEVAGSFADQLLGRMLRRTLLALAIAAFAIVALYYFTIAGMLGLELQFGALQARLIIGAIYAVVAVICAIVWLVLSRRPASARAPTLSNPREMQLAMLVEAVMLGYSLARKSPRAP